LVFVIPLSAYMYTVVSPLFFVSSFVVGCCGYVDVAAAVHGGVVVGVLVVVIIVVVGVVVLRVIVVFDVSVDVAVSCVW